MAATFFSGTGSPNGVVFGNPGDAYFDLTGGPPTFWAKQSGVNTNTGWVGLLSGGLLQTLVANVAAATGPIVSAFPAFVPLAPLAIVVVVGAGNSLIAHFTACGTNPGGGGGNETFFQLTVDGVPAKGATFTHGGGAGASPARGCAAIVAKITGLAAGPHTVAIQVAVTPGSSASITPGSGVEHGTLLVEEVSV